MCHAVEKGQFPKWRLKPQPNEDQKFGQNTLISLSMEFSLSCVY